MNKFTRLLFLFLSASSFLKAAAQTYSCGSATGDPVALPAPLEATQATQRNTFARAASPSFFSRTITKSNSLCVLFRVTAAVTGAPLDSLTRYASLSDYNLVPVARSYDGNNWESVAGPYAQHLAVTSCSGSTCSLDIPILNGFPLGKFYLMAFSHSLNARETNARFLMQTTFGPTTASLDSFTGTYADWVRNQMNISPTLHREYFRKRVDGNALGGDIDGSSTSALLKIRGPCEKGSRWRRYAFGNEDWDDEIVVTRRSDGTWLLSINRSGDVGDDTPRTVVNSWKDVDGNNIGEGTWDLCWWGDEALGKRFYIFEPGVGCIEIQGGNPPVNLPFTSSKVKTITLSTLSGPTDTVETYDSLEFGETYYTTSAENASKCNGLTWGDMLNLVGNYNGVQYRFVGYTKLTSNTIESPDASGSGDLVYSSSVEGFCSSPTMNFLNIDSCVYTTAANACSSGWDKVNSGDAVVVCGSRGEVANPEIGKHTFQFAGTTKYKTGSDSADQKKSVFYMIATEVDGEGADQFRQRMAWALSQIIVVTPNQINDDDNSEMYLQYYDIFVRNAFGNYFQILKEVAYSPMMAEMLGYLNSRSTSYVFKDTGNRAFPDENFAREIMQLFTIGVHQLNMDGTLKLNGSQPIDTYDNTDIQNFARVWTAFTTQDRRGNIEGDYWDRNRIDPMTLYGPWRDSFPKMDLDGNYIGDKVPLCVDLPQYQFLKKGAKYRLLGSSLTPLLHHQPSWWIDESYPILAFPLSSQSALFPLLCNGSIGNCNFQPEVTLTTNLNCYSDECGIDEMRVVQVQSNPPVYYEYMRPACVEMAFYENALTINNQWPLESMCANSKLPMARDACCDNPPWTATALCKFTNERTTFATSTARCGLEPCAYEWISSSNSAEHCINWMEDAYFWAGNEPCVLQAKVSSTGTIAIVHNPYVVNDRITESRVARDNLNYFKVAWKGSFPSVSANSCGNGICETFDGTCLCDITIQETPVFTSGIPSTADIISRLHVGGVDVTSFPSGTYISAGASGGVAVFHKNGSNPYSVDTVFRATYRGKTAYFKNVESQVTIGNNAFAFRNPPQFLNPALHEPRDAMYETDEVLKHLFHHENVAPFLALRLIQRFGISNPSPRYIETVANAFKTGSYLSGGQSFGDGEYGNLGATAAAIVLDREARSVILDADPTGGSLREPTLKVIAFMRAMEFTRATNAPELRLNNLQSRIGQAPHAIPNVFSFFLPAYAAPGHIKAAAVTSPEAQVLTGPKIIQFINGLVSLIDFGLNHCFGGFGDDAMWCPSIEWGGTIYNRGELNYIKSKQLAGNDLVDDLATLLTAGRLSDRSRAALVDAYNTATNTASALEGRKYTTKLLITSPEFHTTNIVNPKVSNRPDYETPSPSNNAYKAVIFLMLDGGVDSHNMLMPNSNSCSGPNPNMHAHYSSVRSGLAIDRNSMLSIDASGSNQVCSTFGLHPNLSALKNLYDAGDLLWVSNTGVLQTANTDKENWWQQTSDTVLFAHNLQSDEVQNMDIFENQAGRGVGGRIADVLNRLGHNAAAVSVRGVAEALASSQSPLTIVESDGIEKMNPNPYSTLSDSFVTKVRDINKATNIGSGLFAETWGSLLSNGIGENELLFDALDSATLQQTFTDDNYLSQQFATVAKMIKTRDIRGTDRDIFYVEQTGFDTHGDLLLFFDELTTTLNQGIDEFKKEMDYQGHWNDVTIVMVSEFARTLLENSGAGSDHAWGGNYFVAGGDVDGGKILGQYPNTLDSSSPLIFEPGIVIPTTPWEAVWNGVSQWMGITNASDLDEILPNRNTFSNLFSRATIYGGSNPPPPPTRSPTRAPTRAPTRSPTPDGPCVDDRDFTFTLNNGKTQKCRWLTANANAASARLAKYCGKDDVASGCRLSCSVCVANPTPAPSCKDDPGFTFILDNGKNKFCSWLTANAGAASARIEKYCGKDDVATGCTLSCNLCPQLCEDDRSFTFRLDNGNMQNCNWLTANESKTAFRTGKYCAKDDVSSACAESCSSCP